MNSQNSIDSVNATFVRPPFLVITGFSNLPHGKYYFAFLCVVFVVSVLANSFVMFIIYKENSFHTPKYMAMFHLAVVDLGESSGFIPTVIAVLLFDVQYISYDGCFVHMFFAYFFSGLHVLTLTLMAYDRLVAICFPLRYHAIITIPVMLAMLAVLWAFSIVMIGFTVILLTKLSICKSVVIESYICDHEPFLRLACNDNSESRLMTYITIALCIYAPFILTVVPYVFIAAAVFKIASWKGRVKACKTFSAHLIMVAARYIPLLGTYVTDVIVALPFKVRIVNTSLILAITPMLNPIIYVLNTEEFMTHSKRLLKMKIATTEIN